MRLSVIARGDDEDVGAALMQLGEVFRERGEPGVAEPAPGPVDQQA